MNSNINRSQSLIVSALIGAVAGLSVGFMLLKRADDEDRATTLTAGEGLSLGFMILGVLRQVAQLGEGE
jgi:hypothetical protein